MIQCVYCETPIPPGRVPLEGAGMCACETCFNPLVLRRSSGQVTVQPVERMRDVRLLAAEGSIGAELLQRMKDSVSKLPMLPQISRRVLAMAGNPDVGLKEIAALVRNDHALAVRVMKLANSVVYGGLQEVKDLNAACMRLGAKIVANSIQTAAATHLFKTGDAGLAGYMQSLWRHSVATAHAAYELAMLLSMPKAEQLFLAGLVHDIGKSVVVLLLSEAQSGPLSELRESPELRDEVIENFHLLAGIHTVQHWELPQEFAATTFCHHEPGLVPEAKHLSITHAVCLADSIARAEGYTSRRVPEELFLSAMPSSMYLNMTDIRLASLRVDLASKIEALLGE